MKAIGSCHVLFILSERHYHLFPVFCTSSVNHVNLTSSVPLSGWSLRKLPWQHTDAVTSVIKVSPLMVVLKCFLRLKNRTFCPISVPLQQSLDFQDNGNTLYEQTATFSSIDQTIKVNWGRHDMSLQTQQIPIQCLKLSNQWVLAHSNISNEAAYISVECLFQLLERCLFIFLSNCHSILQPFVSHPSTCWQFDWHYFHCSFKKKNLSLSQRFFFCIVYGCQVTLWALRLIFKRTKASNDNTSWC